MKFVAMVSCSKLFGSQIPVTTGGFELQISRMQSRYILYLREDIFKHNFHDRLIVFATADVKLKQHSTYFIVPATQTKE